MVNDICLILKLIFIIHIYFGDAFRVQLYTLSSHMCNNFFVKRQFYQTL